MRYPLAFDNGEFVTSLSLGVQMQKADGSKPQPIKKSTSVPALNNVIPIVGVALKMDRPPPAAIERPAPPPLCVDVVYWDDAFDGDDEDKLSTRPGYVIPYQVATGFTDIDYEIIGGDAITPSGFSPGDDYDRVAWLSAPVDGTDYTVEATIAFTPSFVLGLSFAELYLLARGSDTNFPDGDVQAPAAVRAWLQFGTGPDGNVEVAIGEHRSNIDSISVFRDVNFGAVLTVALRVEGDKGSILLNGLPVIKNASIDLLDAGFVGFMLTDNQDDFGTVRMNRFRVYHPCPSACDTAAGVTLFDDEYEDTGDFSTHAPNVGGQYMADSAGSLTIYALDGAGKVTFPTGGPPLVAAQWVSCAAKYSMEQGFTVDTIESAQVIGLTLASASLNDDQALVEVDLTVVEIGATLLFSVYASDGATLFTRTSTFGFAPGDHVLRIEVSDAGARVLLDAAEIDTTDQSPDIPADGLFWQAEDSGTDTSRASYLVMTSL